MTRLKWKGTSASGVDNTKTDLRESGAAHERESLGKAFSKSFHGSIEKALRDSPAAFHFPVCH